MTPNRASHIGDFLQFYLDEQGISQHELSKSVGVKPEEIGEICTGKHDISPDMAIKIAAVLGTSPELWSRRDFQVDVSREESYGTSKSN